MRTFKGAEESGHHREEFSCEGAQEHGRDRNRGRLLAKQSTDLLISCVDFCIDVEECYDNLVVAWALRGEEPK
jgi:hypothetical protein